MSNDKTTEVIRTYLASCNGDTVVHVPKDHIIATLSQVCSANGIDPKVRDNHPFMKKLHEAQDGVVFTSYQDILAFAEDVVSGLPDPSTPLPTSSKELEALEEELARDDLSMEEKKKLFDRHQETSKILNEVLMAEKRKGFFHKPKENVYFVSEESIQRYLSEQKRSAKQENPIGSQSQDNNLIESPSNPTKSVPKPTQSTQGQEKSTGKVGKRDFTPLIEQHEKMHAEKMRAQDEYMKQNKASMDTHLAYRNPSRHVVESLMKIGGFGLDVMGTGLNKILESAFSKKEPGNQVFLSSIANRNHQWVSQSINESSLAIGELSSMMNNKELTGDDVNKANKLLASISDNTSLLSEKNKKGVLNASDRAAISEHSEKLSEFMEKLKESDLANAIDNENIKKIFESIFTALKSILSGEKRQDPEPCQP